MKKIILKVLLWVSRLAGVYGIGYLFGSIAMWIFNKIVDEAFAEKHPVITIMLYVLALAVATGASALIAFYPLTWVFEWFNKKIDDIEDDPFDR